MSLVGPRPCIPYETEHFAAAPLRALPRAAGHHRPLAGDRARALRPSARRSTWTSRYARSWSLGLDLRAAAADAARTSSGRRGVTAREPPPVRVAVVGLGYWGPNLVRNLDELAEAEVVCDLRPRPRAARRRSAGATRPCATTTRFDDAARRRRRRRGRDRDAGLDALRARARGARRPASTSSSRSRSRRRSAEAARARSRLADERGLRADAGPHVPLQPAGRTRSATLIDARRARRHLLHLDEPREPRAAPVRRERRLGPRPARLLDPPLLARRDAAPRRARSSRGCVIPAIPDVAFINLEFAVGHDRPRRARRGSRRASCAGRRSSARRRWSSTTTRATSRSASSTRASTLRDPETFGEYQLTYRTGDIVSPARRRRRAAARSRWRTSAAPIRDRDDAALVGRARARGRADDRGGRHLPRPGRRSGERRVTHARRGRRNLERRRVTPSSWPIGRS